MKAENREILRKFAELGSVGFTLVILTFLGLGSGIVLDRLTGLTPLFTIVLLLAGVISGLMYIIYKYGSHEKK